MVAYIQGGTKEAAQKGLIYHTAKNASANDGWMDAVQDLLGDVAGDGRGLFDL